MPNISLDRAVQSPEITFIRWKVHQDWVSKVKYLLILLLSLLMYVFFSSSHPMLFYCCNAHGYTLQSIVHIPSVH